MNNTNPEVGLLGNYGGPTLTVPLLLGSPAIDAGSNSINGIVVPTGDQRGAVPLDAYDQSSRAAAAAFDAPGALNRPCAVSYGPVPGSVYAGHRFLDVLIHGWDLAVATGQDTHLDPALVEACWDEIQPQADSLQASGMFGQPGSAAPDADPQTRLLAALGRRTDSRI